MNKSPELGTYIPEIRPNFASSWDDEFDGYALSTKWNKTFYTSNPSLVENVKQSAFSLENIDPNITTVNFARYYQPAPSWPWRIQGDFETYSSVLSGLPGCGLSVVGTGTTSQEILIQNNSNRQIVIQNITTSTGVVSSTIASTNLGVTNAPFVLGLGRIRFQIRYDGTTLFFDRAIGGTHFSGFTNWTSTASSGISKIGFCLSNRSSINWFRVKTDSAKYMIDID